MRKVRCVAVCLPLLAGAVNVPARDKQRALGEGSSLLHRPQRHAVLPRARRSAAPHAAQRPHAHAVSTQHETNVSEPALPCRP